MNSIKRFVLPAQLVALFTIPAIMVFIITLVFAGVIAVLTPATFSDVTGSTPMWVINFLLYIGFIIATGDWMWEGK